MIREAGEAELSRLLPDREAAVKIRALWEAYGTQHAFLRFWSGDRGECIALMDGQAILVCDTGDLCLDNDELLCFLSMQTEIRGIRTDAQTAEWLFAHLGGRLETGEVMQPALAFTQSSNVVKPFTERETYPLLKQVFGEAMPPFEAWYVDVSHRRRHGLCRIVGIEERGEAAATAMTVAECTGHALIGAVATAPQSRGKGYASACVSTLTQLLQREGKQVWLSPKNEKAKRLYEHLGFKSVDRWGSLQFVEKSL